jgi:hypothetical protein
MIGGATAPDWGTSRVHSFFALAGGRVRRRGLELVTRYLLPGFRRGNDSESRWGHPFSGSSKMGGACAGVKPSSDPAMPLA